MTGAEFSEVDLDRLADYAAGVLDPVEASQVEDLVRTQPPWAAAHGALMTADAVIAAQLRAFGAEPVEPIPIDVTARLDAAFGARGRTREMPKIVVRQPRVRWRNVALAAAAVVAIALFGTPVLAGMFGRSETSAGMATSAKAPTPALDAGGAQNFSNMAGAPAYAGGPYLFASGTDYRPDTLAQLTKLYREAVVVPEPAAASRNQQPEKSMDLAAGSATQLSRLLAPAALRLCLDAVATIVSGAPETVDYARYEGRPALVVLVAAGSTGTPSGELATSRSPTTAVIVGPLCGLRGADRIAVQPLG